MTFITVSSDFYAKGIEYQCCLGAEGLICLLAWFHAELAGAKRDDTGLCSLSTTVLSAFLVSHVTRLLYHGVMVTLLQDLISVTHFNC